MDLKDIDVTLMTFTNRTIAPRQKAAGVQKGFKLTTSILTPELVQRICKLYEVDLQMMRETRIGHSICMEDI